MKHLVAAVIAMGAVLAGCAPPPVYTAQAALPVPLVEQRRQQDCAMLAAELARQQRIAELSGVMANALVEASVRLNTVNVINGIETRAALAGCR